MQKIMINTENVNSLLLTEGLRLTSDKTVSANKIVGWMENLVCSIGFDQAISIIEHLWGVIPILDFFHNETDSPNGLGLLLSGNQLGTLGIFTPTPLFSFTSATVSALATADNELELTGEIRASGDSPHCSVVLTRTDDNILRLAVVFAQSEGVGITETRGGVALGRGAWWNLHGVKVSRDLISAPLLSLDVLTPILDAYAVAYALVAVLYAKRGVLSLRSALRKTVHASMSFNMSQVVAMGITEIEIQVDLLECAVRQQIDGAGFGSALRSKRSNISEVSGLVLAATASRILCLITDKAMELDSEAGMTCSDWPFSTSPHSLARTTFGGRLMLESELARTMGL